MKQVQIKSMALHYFKGTVNAKIDFFAPITTISGPNGCGKSTVMDAFFWCLWGKSAAGRTDFALKTNDRDGHEIPHVDHSVTLTLSVDGHEQTFERTLTPKYDKEGQLKGNTTTYVWNQVPCKMAEYNQKVADVIREDTFKLIASPTAFLALDWKQQRDTLIRLAGEVDDYDVATTLDNDSTTGEYHTLLEQLTGKTLAEYRRELDSKIKRINEQMQGIPARIDEVTRNTPAAPDMEALLTQREELRNQLAAIEEQERDDAKAYAARNADRNAVLKSINDLTLQRTQAINDAEAKERMAIHEANQTYIRAEAEYKQLTTEQDADLKSTDSRQQTIKRSIEANRQQSNNINQQLAQLRQTWTEENARQFQASQFLTCPLYGHQCTDQTACSQYDQNQQGAYIKFVEAKRASLDAINAQGTELGTQIKQIIATIDSQLSELNDLNAEIATKMQQRRDRMAELEQTMNLNPKRPLIVKIDPATIAGIPELDTQISALQDQLKGMTSEEPVNTDNSAAKEAIRRALADLDVEEAKNTQIAKATKRIEELQQELSTLGAEKATLEHQRDLVNAFEIARTTAVSERVNAMFQIVKWQMFERQVNGEEVPACICMIDGVPYASANKASQVNGGIDIASTLANSIKSFAPIFIDNAESITHIYTPSNLPIQQIRLKVDSTVTALTATK